MALVIIPKDSMCSRRRMSEKKKCIVERVTERRGELLFSLSNKETFVGLNALPVLQERRRDGLSVAVWLLI